MHLQILDLRDAPQYLDTLARWHHEEWSHFNPGSTLAQRIDKMQAFLSEGFIPCTFIARLKSTLLGSAALVAQDMETRPELTPWLASVFVDPRFRRQGIGSQLVLHTMQQARNEGICYLYLYTPDQEAFYQRLGWVTIEKENYKGHVVTIMKVDLTIQEGTV